MSDIFINYRHSDTADSAGRLYEGLRARFGRRRVFFDISGIEAGQDIERSIRARVGTCRVLLALIGENWLEAADEQGQRRLDVPGDAVRLEIATALAAEVQVIPVLLHDASMPGLESLPEDLSALATLKSARLRHESWDADFEKLSERLGRLVKGGYGERLRRTWRRLILPATLAALALLAGWLLWTEAPHVEGLTVEAATAVLDAKGIGYRVDYLDRPSQGLGSRVAAQEPQAGERANRLAGVRLEVVPGTLPANPPSRTEGSQDAELRLAVLGTWRQVRQFSGALVDQRATLRPDGRAEWQGEAIVYGRTTPYLLRGDWEILDGLLKYRVQTSTVPGFLPPGYRGEADILAVTADRMATLDRIDGQIYVDPRVP